MTRIVGTTRTQFGEQWTLDFSLTGAFEGRRLRSLVHIPRSFMPDGPVVVVMHGVTRAADQYMNSWMGAAERMGFLLIVPEFSKESWPKSRHYNQGNMRRVDGAIRPRREWTFTILDEVVAASQKAVGSTAERFCLYGHSAGAQFVHRYLLFAAGEKLAAAVSANAGWYTLPTHGVEFPYGLGGTNVSESRLRDVLSTPFTILVGSEDTDGNDPDLRRSSKAMAQGLNRLARARTFFETAQFEARQLQMRHNWNYREIAGVGHNDRDLAEVAARVLVDAMPERMFEMTSGAFPCPVQQQVPGSAWKPRGELQDYWLSECEYQ